MHNASGQPFVTDYSSLPWGTRWTMKWSKVDIAGVVHDKLYRDPNYSRWTAERVWYRVAKSGDHSANRIQAVAGYFGLVLGGWLVKPTGKGCTRLQKIVMGTIEFLFLVLLGLLLYLWMWQATAVYVLAITIFVVKLLV